MSLRARLIASENERYEAELTAAKARHDAALKELQAFPDQDEPASTNRNEWLSNADLAEAWGIPKDTARKRVDRIDEKTPLERRKANGRRLISRRSLEAATGEPVQKCPSLRR